MASHQNGDAHDAMGRILQRCRVLSERVAQHNRRVKAEEQALGSDTCLLRKDLEAKAREARRGASSDGGLPDGHLDELYKAKKLFEGQGPGGDLRLMDATKRRAPLLLKLLLGKETTGVLIRHDQRLKLKQEYYKFRHSTASMFTVVPFVLTLGLRRAKQLRAVGENLSLSPPLWVALQAYAVWLVYFYASLALRENVLVMNGSDIRPWWIQHHYVMLLFTLVLLSLPTESTAYQVFSQKFLFYNCFQGLIMMFQNRYQSRRLYRQIALGRNSMMDVVSTETTPGKGHLLLLYPALFAMQGSQFLIGINAIVFSYKDMFKASGWLDDINSATSADLRGARGVFICGVLFLILAVGNFTSTVATIAHKVKKSRMRSAIKKTNQAEAKKAA